MRAVGQHSKYKTQKCQNYWLLGYCAYGPRCKFLHYEEKDSSGFLWQIKANSAERSRKGSLDSDSNNLESSTELSTDPSPEPSMELVTEPRTQPTLEHNMKNKISSSRTKLQLPPTPLPLEKLYRPSVGSGRLAALIRGEELHWIDIRTMRYV